VAGFLPARLGRRAVADQVLEDAAVAGYRRSHVPGAHIVAALDHERRLPCRQELGHDLAVLSLLDDGILKVVPALREHALDEVTKFRQGLDRRRLELGFESLKLALPLVPVKAWLGRRHGACLLARRRLQTRRHRQ
jgi:hypothetical protein